MSASFTRTPSSGLAASWIVVLLSHPTGTLSADEVIARASTPPEIAFIEQLLDAPDDPARRRLLEANPDMVTPELMDALTNIVAQVESSQDESLTQAIKALYKLVLRYSMEMQMKE